MASTFTRLYTVQDEIVLLQSALKFKSQYGQDPVDNISVFTDFVNPGLSFKATSKQVGDKIRRFKKTFTNNTIKKGPNPYFSRDHDAKLFKLSKKIWGSSPDGDSESGENDQVDSSDDYVKENDNGNVKDRVEGYRLLYPLLCASIESEAKNATKLLSSEEYVNKAMRKIGEDKAGKLEKEWRDYVMMEQQVYVKRTKMICKQAQVLNDVASSSAGKYM